MVQLSDVAKIIIIIERGACFIGKNIGEIFFNIFTYVSLMKNIVRKTEKMGLLRGFSMGRRQLVEASVCKSIANGVAICGK